MTCMREQISLHAHNFIAITVVKNGLGQNGLPLKLNYDDKSFEKWAPGSRRYTGRALEVYVLEIRRECPYKEDIIARYTYYTQYNHILCENALHIFGFHSISILHETASKQIYESLPSTFSMGYIVVTFTHRSLRLLLYYNARPLYYIACYFCNIQLVGLI